MNLYSIDVQIAATAYIKANSEAEARAKAAALKDENPAILDSEGDVEISGASFDDPSLPDVSLSPAMTIKGLWPGDTCELQQTNVPAFVPEL